MSTGNGRLKWRQLSLRRDAGHNLATPPTFPRARRPSTEAPNRKKLSVEDGKCRPARVN